MDGRARLAARRRRRDLRRARAPQDLPRQVRRRSLPRDPPHRAPARHAHQHHDALRPHRDGRRARRPHAAGRARCRTTPAGSRRSSRWRSIPTTTRCASCRRRPPTDTLRVHAVVAADARQRRRTSRRSGSRPASKSRRSALWFGVDDLDGTVQEEKIYHMAGARTPEAMTTSDIRRLIRRPAASRSSATRSTTSSPVPRPRMRSLRAVA